VVKFYPALKGKVERKSQKTEEGSAVERHFETGLWPTNEDRLYGKLAPMKPPCEARK
jgi:hypothetical protein